LAGAARGCQRLLQEGVNPKEREKDQGDGNVRGVTFQINARARAIFTKQKKKEGGPGPKTFSDPGSGGEGGGPD